MSRLAVGFVFDHEGKAAWAASTAWVQSSFDAYEDFHTVFPVEGLTTSIVDEVFSSFPSI